ncbi:unnamed protein product [Penicillium bialowiezense]
MSPARSSRSIQLLLLLLTFLSFSSLTLASTPASFCKCTCFSNSTIIPLNPGKSESNIDHLIHLYERDASPELELDLESTDNEKRASKYRSLSCNDCNRKFCLDYELPTCKGAKETDVTTTCFRMWAEIAVRTGANRSRTRLEEGRSGDLYFYLYDGGTVGLGGL